MAHIELRSLQHVVALARERSFTRAARRVHLSQPAFSRSIQAVEERLQLRLFDRDRGGVRLTAAGRQFTAKAEDLLRQAGELERLAALVAGGESGEVYFGLAPLPAKALLPRLAPELVAGDSGARWRVEVKTAHDLLAQLLNDDIEFFVCAEEQLPGGAPIEAQALGRFPLCFAVRAGHPLLGDERTWPARQFPVITAGPISADNFQGFPQPWLSRFEQPPRLVTSDYNLLARLTAGSDAIWPISTLAIAEELRTGQLQLLPVQGGRAVTGFRMMCYRLQDRTLSPAAERLLQRIGEEMASLLDAGA